ncbi:Peroxisome assembly factor 2 [Nymphon striatum]|nr:Peroxisome assembly factor 2 [Nymphon striatum]
MEAITSSLKLTNLLCHEDFHSLHACLSFPCFESLSKESILRNELICMMETCDSVKIYIVVHPIHILEGKSYLSVTNKFLDHYGLYDSQTVSLRTVKIFQLDKVVFGAKTRIAFKCINEALKNGSMIRNLNNNNALCRQGDVFLFSNIKSLKFRYSDIITCECIPFHQGYVSAKTSIILVNLEKDCIPQEPSNSYISHWNVANFPNQVQMYQYINHQQKNISMNQLEQLPGRLTNNPAMNVSILPNSPFISDNSNICDKLAVIFVPDSFLKRHCIPDKSWVTVEIAYRENKSLECSLYSESSDCSLDNSKLKGFNSSIYFSHYFDAVVDEESGYSSKESQSLTPIKARSRNLNSFCENEAKFMKNNSPENFGKDLTEVSELLNNRKRHDSSDILKNIMESVQSKTSVHSGIFSKKLQTVQIISLCEENQKYLNMKLFHYNGSEQAFIQPLLWFNLNHQPAELIQPNAQILITKSYGNDTGEFPKSAKNIHVTLIKSPEYGNNINMEKNLKKYFSSPSLPVIYLRVEKIDGKTEDDTALVSSNTLIYQIEHKGFDNFYVPRIMENFLLDLPLHPIWDSPVPSGLLPYVLRMKDIVLPFLKDWQVMFSKIGLIIVPFCFKALESKMPPTVFISGYEGSGKATVARAVAKLLNLHIKEVNCFSLNGDTIAATESRISHVFERALQFTPCVALFKNVDAIGRNRDEPGYDLRAVNTFIESVLKSYKNAAEYPIIIVGTGLLSSCHPSIRNAFIHHINMKCPTTFEKTVMLEGLLSDVNVGIGVSLTPIAEKCPGFFLKDLCILISEAKKFAYERLIKVSHDAVSLVQEEESVCMAGVCILQEDFNHALRIVQAAHSAAIGTPKIPDVTWKNVGGLEDVKNEILDTIQLPLENPNFITSSLQRSGVLLFGPPGTGKTLLAKAVAHECSLNFFSVKGPELIDSYFGQSEANIREVFKQARNAAPCVIFFDELDSLAPSRGKNSDAGGVVNRIVSQLLAEMDCINKAAEVFIIGATNRPDLLDPALLRPGRFDCRLYVGISQNRADQLKILNALTKDFLLAPDVDFNRLIDDCPPNMTGADFYALCCDAMMNAISRIIEDENVHYEETDMKTDVIVMLEDFQIALKSLVPSVSLEELDHYEKIRSDLQNC